MVIADFLRTARTSSILTFAGILATAVFASAASGDNCSSVFQFSVTPYLGRQIAPGKSLLGEGYLGGRVYLIDSPEGDRFVRKELADSETYQNDKAAFEIWDEIFQRNPSTRWSVVKRLAYNDEAHSMDLEWVPGETLNNKSSEALKNKDDATFTIITRWEFELNDILSKGLTQLAEEGWRGMKILSLEENWNMHMRAKVEITNELGERFEVELFAKSDNVIIQNSPRRLVIIDPF